MDIIYHYTDLNGLLSIIQNKKLWLSNFKNLNDYQEIHWFRNKLKIAMDEVTKNNEKIVGLDSLFKDVWVNQKYQSSDAYICSFSSEKDILSQWRSYADDGRGVSIGFNKKSFNLQNTPTFNSGNLEDTVALNEVIYDESEQNLLISKFLNGIVDLAKKGVKSNTIDFLEYTSTANLFAVSFKNQAFKEEKEVRITNQIGMESSNKWYGNISPAKHRVSAGTITTYFEWHYPTMGGDIVEIVLGPKCQMTIQDLKLFLQSNNFNNVKIRSSTASYR